MLHSRPILTTTGIALLVALSSCSGFEKQPDRFNRVVGSRHTPVLNPGGTDFRPPAEQGSEDPYALAGGGEMPAGMMANAPAMAAQPQAMAAPVENISMAANDTPMSATSTAPMADYQPMENDSSRYPALGDVPDKPASFDADAARARQDASGMAKDAEQGIPAAPVAPPVPLPAPAAAPEAVPQSPRADALPGPAATYETEMQTARSVPADNPPAPVEQTPAAPPMPVEETNAVADRPVPQVAEQAAPMPEQAPVAEEQQVASAAPVDVGTPPVVAGTVESPATDRGLQVQPLRSENGYATLPDSRYASRHGKSRPQSF